MTREEAIRHFEYGVSHDIFSEPVTSYAKMAIAALREQPRWISVEERLPKDEKSVLAYYGFDNDGDGDLGMMFTGTLSYFCFDPDPHWQHASCNLVVTHWMPLPEPPEVEG